MVCKYFLPVCGLYSHCLDELNFSLLKQLLFNWLLDDDKKKERKREKNKTKENRNNYQSVKTFGISGPHWKKKGCLGPHVKYIVTHNHKKPHNVLSKFTILCWAAFIAILGRMLPVGCGWDTPESYCTYSMLIKNIEIKEKISSMDDYSDNCHGVIIFVTCCDLGAWQLPQAIPPPNLAAVDIISPTLQMLKRRLRLHMSKE